MKVLLLFIIFVIGYVRGSILTHLQPIGRQQRLRECDKTASCISVLYTAEHLHCALVAANGKNKTFGKTCPEYKKVISLKSGKDVCISSDCPLWNNLTRVETLDVGSVAHTLATQTCQASCAVCCRGDGFWRFTDVALNPCSGAVHLSNKSNGLLELFYSNTWGTVCDDRFNSLDASVVCKSLGYTTGQSYTHGAQKRNDYDYYGDGTKIWLDEVGCTGSESCLTECSHNGWGIHDCSQGENVGLICT